MTDVGFYFLCRVSMGATVPRGRSSTQLRGSARAASPQTPVFHSRRRYRICAPLRVTRHPCTHEANASFVVCCGCARCSLRSSAPWGRIRGRAVRTVVAGRTIMMTSGGSSSSRRKVRVRLACLVARRAAGGWVWLLLGVFACYDGFGVVVGRVFGCGTVMWVRVVSRASRPRFLWLFPAAVLRETLFRVVCSVRAVC